MGATRARPPRPVRPRTRRATRTSLSASAAPATSPRSASRTTRRPARSATGSTASSGTGGGGEAQATATQTSPGNINVVVRVASPGDNGAVTQQNTVGASAGPSSSSTPVGAIASSGGPAGTDQLVSTSNTQTDVTNNGTVDQQLIQTQDGPGPDVNTVGDAAIDPAASSSIGSALATQTGAQNINVSIRIGSSGSDGIVTQTNGAIASGTSPGLSTVNVTGGSNSNVSIVLPGSAGGAPGDQWVWNWTWTGDGTPHGRTARAPRRPTARRGTGLGFPSRRISDCGQLGTTSTPAVKASAAGTTSTPGMFTWTWIWTTADGVVRTLTQQQACDCNWQWNWTWDWSSGTPDLDGGAADRRRAFDRQRSNRRFRRRSEHDV